MNTLLVEVLQARIVLDGRELRIQPRPLEICIALATHDRRLTTEQLCELIFPEENAVTASGRLRVYAHRLREQAPGIIERAASGYALGDAVRVDIDEISAALHTPFADERALLEAIRLLHMPRHAFPHCRWSWFAPVEARIAALADDALALLARRALREEDLPNAIVIARTALRNDPLSESAYTLMIDALTRLGRITEAVKAYRLYEQKLYEELHCTPSAKVRALAGSMLVT